MTLLRCTAARTTLRSVAPKEAWAPSGGSEYTQ